ALYSACYGLYRCPTWASSVFFFSSRRRHTRSKRDWSSDVCSSDLTSTSSARLSALHLSISGFIELVDVAIGSSFADFAFCRTGGYGYWFFIRRFRGLLNRWMQLAFFVRRLQGYIELIDKLHISPAFLRYIEKIPNLRMFKNNQGTKRRRCGRESVQKCKRGIIR